MLIIGIAAAAVLIPASFFVRQPPAMPARRSAAPAPVQADGSQWTVAHALRTPQFISLALHNSQAARRIIANAAVPDGFLESVSVAVQSSPSLKDASAVDPEAVRDVIRFSAAYAPVAEELEALARAVRHTISVKRAETAQSSLAAYDLAKGLARKTDGADLVPHIAEMRKNLNRGGSRRRMAAKPATNS